MKLHSFLIPAIAITTLQLSAQKSTNPHTDLLPLHRANEASFSTGRIYPNSDENKLKFINCWIKPLDASVNTKFPEYTPVFNDKGDMMFFTSRRPENTGNRKTIDPIYKAEDIYFSTKTPEGTWTSAQKLSGNLNTFRNEAVTWVSNDAKTMILCQNEDLFTSRFENGSWTKPEPMNALNSDYRETHASFSPDGNTIYFTTDNPDLATVGGLDICKVERDPSGEWMKPVIVENINSTLNEEDPTLMADGKTLYFSSQGFGSMGGFDIYKATMNPDKVFSDPVNLGFPLNTEADEPFISLSKDGKKGYLSSDRGDGKEQNIYEITFLDMIKVPLLVEVYDAETKQLINSDATLVDLKKDKKEIYLDNMTSGVFGAEDLNMETYFTLTVEAKDHESKTISLNTVGLKEFDPANFKLEEKVYLTPIKKEEPEIIKMDKVLHFEINKSVLNHHSVHIVNKIKEFMLSNPSAKIVVHAHTDNKGTDELNMKLSENRAQSVADWFVQNGIDSNRIITKYYGESKPAVDNDSDEHRAKNRRAEIEIIF